jgi:hypothetical protein
MKKYFEHHFCFWMETKKIQERPVKIFWLPSPPENNPGCADMCSVFWNYHSKDGHECLPVPLNGVLLSTRYHTNLSKHIANYLQRVFTFRTECIHS